MKLENLQTELRKSQTIQFAEIKNQQKLFLTRLELFQSHKSNRSKIFSFFKKPENVRTNQCCSVLSEKILLISKLPAHFCPSWQDDPAQLDPLQHSNTVHTSVHETAVMHRTQCIVLWALVHLCLQCINGRILHLDTVLYWELSASSMLYALTFRPPLLAWFGLDIDGGEEKG